MAQWVLPDREHCHRFDGTLQNGQRQRELSGLTAHLNCFDPIGPAKQEQTQLILQLLQLDGFTWIHTSSHSTLSSVKSSCGIYLCEAQLGCMRGAGTLFSSWIMVSLSVEMVRTLEPLMEPFHLNSPADVMQNLWERCRLLSWSWGENTFYVWLTPTIITADSFNSKKKVGY